MFAQFWSGICLLWWCVGCWLPTELWFTNKWVSPVPPNSLLHPQKMLESKECSMDVLCFALFFFLFKRMPPPHSSSKHPWNIHAQNSCHLGEVGIGVVPLPLGISPIPYVAAMPTFWLKRACLLLMLPVSSPFSPAAIATFLSHKGNSEILFFLKIWVHSEKAQVSASSALWVRRAWRGH